jgi:hypothetical protein
LALIRASEFTDDADHDAALDFTSGAAQKSPVVLVFVCFMSWLCLQISDCNWAVLRIQGCTPVALPINHQYIDREKKNERNENGNEIAP